MLGWARDAVKKSKAAAIIQTMFECLPIPWILPLTRAKLANALVERAWYREADLINGKLYPSPHAVSVAAISLANGLSDQGSSVTSLFCQGALGRLLADVTQNRWPHPLNGADLLLLEAAAIQFMNFELDEDTGENVNSDMSADVTSKQDLSSIRTMSDTELANRSLRLAERLKAISH
ncbi:hypothetical protein [Sphingomonas sp. 37zxx]|uniref:hypothetical protein n=1 Tax=Sphingomonas sp. 37zxx TaxID=1550073 RepID=UPI0012E049A7|nr:hypothetical protein [Sphingomonas sp. 37zxx]